MAKGLTDSVCISDEARQWVDDQAVKVMRHVMARASVFVAESNSDVVRRSHVEAAWQEVLGKRSHKKWVGIAVAVSAVAGGVIQGLFGGFGKSIGEQFFRLFH